jgi:hypothetical protein
MKVEFEMNIKNIDGSTRKKRDGRVNGKGNLIKEYEHFYLIQLSKYRTCINKADIACGNARINFLKEAIK